MFMCIFLFYLFIWEAKSDCIMYPQKGYQCDDSDAKSTIKIKDKKGNGMSKVFDVEIDLSEDILGDEQYEFEVFNWQGAIWTSIALQSGGVCHGIENMCEKGWGRVMSKVQPALDDTCKTKKGFYQVQDLEFHKDDFEVELDNVEKIKAKMLIFNQIREPILCSVLEIDVKC